MQSVSGSPQHCLTINVLSLANMCTFTCLCLSAVLPEVSLPHSHISQTIGQDTLLECFVTANPADVMEWHKDGGVVGESPRHRLEVWERDIYTKTLALFVLDLEEEDYGRYTCMARNEYGTTNATMRLLGKAGTDSTERKCLWDKYFASINLLSWN